MKWNSIYRFWCSAILSDPNGLRQEHLMLHLMHSVVQHPNTNLWVFVFLWFFFLCLFKNDNTIPEPSGSKPELFWHWEGCTDPAKMELCLHKMLWVAFSRNSQWKQKSMNKTVSDHQTQFSQLAGVNSSAGQYSFEICLLQRAKLYLLKLYKFIFSFRKLPLMRDSKGH